ncbi:MAG: hypothetical protein U5L07_08505 [Desulfobacterales bacterium]|nr:hypothetical protein [Desulfobacterales bacterium]
MAINLAKITTTYGLELLICVKQNHDSLLCQRLQALTKTDKDYWSFRGNCRREYSHGMFQYPAMMVPQVAQAILQQIYVVHPELEWVGDPFSGSGTIMTESMMNGLAFSGTDINPLAVLICRVKSGPYFTKALKEKIENLKACIVSDRKWTVETSFPNIEKWFNKDIQIALSKIQRGIRKEKAAWARSFFWIALAETVRASSNSRTSTYKLHIRPQKEIEGRISDPIKVFKNTLDRNFKHYQEQAKRLSNAGYLQRGRYQREVSVSLADIRDFNQRKKVDTIITSPPYGDNATTVPYGQYSYLPLQWVDLEDIDPNIDKDCLISTHELDSRSLGGRKRLIKSEADQITQRSSALAKYMKSLNGQPRDRAIRVIAFFRDIDASLGPILKGLNRGGLMVWVLGNRKVGGKRVPFDLILSDLLQEHNAKLLCKLTRSISSKRMALKNNIADTMSKETILVMRKAI